MRGVEGRFRNLEFHGDSKRMEGVEEDGDEGGENYAGDAEEVQGRPMAEGLIRPSAATRRAGSLRTRRRASWPTPRRASGAL